jgi:hypothetical protein
VEVEELQTLKRGSGDAFGLVQASERNIKFPRQDPPQPASAQFTNSEMDTYMPQETYPETEVDTAHTGRHPPDHQNSEARTPSTQASLSPSVPEKSRSIVDAGAIHERVSADDDLDTSMSRSFNPKDEEAKAQESNMQMWWDEAIAKTMNLPKGYEKVSVLLLKWSDHIEELATRNEVSEFPDHLAYTDDLPDHYGRRLLSQPVSLPC